MSDYKKIVVNTKNYSVEDMLQGTQPICDTKILEGNEWSFSQDELPATVYYETTSVEVPKVYTFASDTDHVEDRTGRTQEQINRTFYKRMCKEIPSPSGEPITVKNVEEGYVLSAEIKGNTQLFKRARGSQDEWIVIPNDEGRDTVAFEYKIDSTQAIISNNGETYPIYANEEDKAYKKLISLGGVDDVKDTLEIKEDGSGVKVSSFNKYKLTGSENIELDTTYPPTDTNYLRFRITTPFTLVANPKGQCSVTSWIDLISTSVNKFSFGGTATSRNLVHCIIEKDKLKSQDSAGMAEWLRNNNVEIEAQVTPLVTTIPKEIMPTILTHNKTNILSVGNGVNASSFKFNIPIDKFADLESRMQALESVTVDNILNK